MFCFEVLMIFANSVGPRRKSFALFFILSPICIVRDCSKYDTKQVWKQGGTSKKNVNFAKKNGIVAKTSLKKGLEKTIEWYLNNSTENRFNYFLKNWNY